MTYSTELNKVENKWYTRQQFIFMTLDPVHIGAGGYRLGRVDNSIVREPGTNLPKIPGTSLAGASRQYAAMIYGKPEAAGLHRNFKGERGKCPIIQTFGTANANGGGKAGKVIIGDARILFFPVYSMAGPVWVTTRELLIESGFTTEMVLDSPEKMIISFDWTKPQLNLGWLLLEVEKKNQLHVSPPVTGFESISEWQAIQKRIVMVSTTLFSEIVNSNLEVRTSVAINPETGAAEDGALFTYEALPRTTWLWAELIEDDYSNDFPPTERKFNGLENSGEPLPEKWSRPLDVVKSGLKLMEYLGVGGMGTRGFGRMKIIKDWSAKNNGC